MSDADREERKKEFYRRIERVADVVRVELAGVAEDATLPKPEAVKAVRRRLHTIATAINKYLVWLLKRLARIIPNEKALDNLMFLGLSYNEISLFNEPEQRETGDGRENVRVLITDKERYSFIDTDRIKAIESLDLDSLRIVSYTTPVDPGPWRWSRTGSDGWNTVDFDDDSWEVLTPGCNYPLSTADYVKKTFPDLSLYARGAFFF